MTPEEKAKELIDKFISYADDSMASLACNARNCALICVEELIDSTQPKSRMFRYNEYCLEYWQEVKEELNKL